MQTESVEICPVCNGHAFESTFSCKDYTVSKENFSLKKCVGCNLIITDPRPNQLIISNYYQSTEYISHSNETNNFLDWLYFNARKFTLRQKYKLIASRQTTGSILDYGCGTGEFLNYMAGNNWEVSGVEPSPIAREKASLLHQLNPNRIQESYHQLNENKYNVITLWHVLEHVPNPGQVLKHLKSLLVEKGIIIVAVPNYESYDAQYYREAWAGYDVPRHLWHFPKSALKQLLTNQGLKIDSIIPMKLDAFYVSLLSEKNKRNGKHNISTLVKAFYRGVISNQKAALNLNYSSLIYIASNA